MTGRPLRDRLMRRARRAGASLDVALASSFEDYFALLARWNAKINLTAFNLADPNDEACRDAFTPCPHTGCRRSARRSGFSTGCGVASKVC